VIGTTVARLPQGVPGRGGHRRGRRLRATALPKWRKKRAPSSCACHVAARARPCRLPSAPHRREALLLSDADLSGELDALLNSSSDLTVAAFAERVGGGFGLAKRVARGLIEALGGIEVREPLSGQRALSAAARAACFPVAAGFGCEMRMTIDAARSGLHVREVELPLGHRATVATSAGFVHRARQLRDTVYACGPLGVNYHGLRLPLVGWKVGVTNGPAVAAVAALG